MEGDFLWPFAFIACLKNVSVAIVLHGPYNDGIPMKVNQRHHVVLLVE